MSDMKDSSDLARIANSAYMYTVPMVIMEMTRKNGLRSGANCFGHQRKLSTHKNRWVTTPNNDTLYSSAWLDLDHGPVTITMPATGKRYCSLALMDMYTNNFAVVGTRTTGGDGGRYVVVGPRDEAPHGNTPVIRAPTARVWALARILVDGESDLPAAQAVQDGFGIQGGARDDVAPGEATPRSANWQEYFAAANRLLRREPPPATDGQILRKLSALSIGPDQIFDAQAFNSEQQAAIAAGVEDARAYLVKVQGSRRYAIEGWSYPNFRMGDYEQNYGLRAVVAVGGLGALPIEEAMYMRADGDGANALFDGRADYLLHFDASRLPPVDSFWSLSLYEATDDGEFFFADTPLHRYTIGDRSPSLTFNGDGSLDIWVGAHSPGHVHESNWLPAPALPFSLFFRGYLPRKQLLTGIYRLPAVVRR